MATATATSSSSTKQGATTFANKRSFDDIMKELNNKKSWLDTASGKIKSWAVSSAKSGVSSVFSAAGNVLDSAGDAVEDKVKDIASDVIEAKTGVDVGDTLKNINVPGKAILIAAGVGAAYTLTKKDDNGENLINKIGDWFSSDKTDDTYVAPANNLALQEDMVKQALQNGRAVKILGYTDEQIDNMSTENLYKLYGHMSFIQNMDNETMQTFGKYLNGLYNGETGAYEPDPDRVIKYLENLEAQSDVVFSDQESLEDYFNEANAYSVAEEPNLDALYENVEGLGDTFDAKDVEVAEAISTNRYEDLVASGYVSDVADGFGSTLEDLLEPSL